MGSIPPTESNEKNQTGNQKGKCNNKENPDEKGNDNYHSSHNVSVRLVLAAVSLRGEPVE